MKYAYKNGKILNGTKEMHVHLAGNGKPQKKQRDNAKLVKTLMSNGISRAIAYRMVAGFAKDELLSGVTTIRTVGGLGTFDTRLRDEIKAGKKTGPRILAANEGIIDCAKKAIANDIPVVLGNDVGCPWITQYDFWRELFYFHKYVGVSNIFALYTATARAAEMAGIGAETGTIEPGKCADFIVTAKNPLEDLRALRQIEMVVAKGRKIDHPQVKRNPVVTAELDKFLVD